MLASTVVVLLLLLLMFTLVGCCGCCGEGRQSTTPLDTATTSSTCAQNWKVSEPCHRNHRKIIVYIKMNQIFDRLLLSNISALFGLLRLFHYFFKCSFSWFFLLLLKSNKELDIKVVRVQNWILYIFICLKRIKITTSKTISCSGENAGNFNKNGLLAAQTANWC